MNGYVKKNRNSPIIRTGYCGKLRGEDFIVAGLLAMLCQVGHNGTLLSLKGDF
jgi:hypothetical protein